MYKLTKFGVQLGNASIPNDPANRDWQEYQAWLTKGNTPLPADAEPDPAIQTTKAKLLEIDRSSIRYIREWLSSRSDSPGGLKALETMATLERAKLPK